MSPAPAGADTLGSAFYGLAANGTWSLYALDDAGGEVGNITVAGELAITSSGAPCGPRPCPAATGATAAARSAKAIVSFTAPASTGGSPITGYTVVSAPDGGVDTNAGTRSLSHVVSGLTNGIAYTFRVRATQSVGNSVLSASSNSVTPPGFIDFPLQDGVTRIKAVHITELRKRIDVQRDRFGLLGFSWTNVTLTPGVTVIRAVHITEMRIALEQTYVNAGITPVPSYSDASLGAGMPVRAVHISQIQFYVIAIE